MRVFDDALGVRGAEATRIRLCGFLAAASLMAVVWKDLRHKVLQVFPKRGTDRLKVDMTGVELGLRIN